VVVACSAIETARLLLHSKSARSPQGLANSSGLVGRNLMFSTFSGGRAAYPVGHPAFSPSYRTHPFLDLALQDFYAPAKSPKAGTILFLLPHPNPIHHAERLAVGEGQIVFGAALKRKMKEFFVETRSLEFETFGEYLPTAGTRVQLDDRARDKHGMPSARILIAHHADDLVASRLLSDRAMDVLTATSPMKVERGGVGGESMVLQMGTCRMGKKPAHSVLDAGCRAHEVPNLFVSDASSFPSSGGVPITLTIMANALRVGRGIAARAKRREL
jgi:choline dehydrogenase-like flavoprotein